MGYDSQEETFNLQLGSTLMVSIYIYIDIACVAQWIGRMTPNDASAGSIPRSRLKIYNWVAPLCLLFILHVSHCLIVFNICIKQ